MLPSLIVPHRIAHALAFGVPNVQLGESSCGKEANVNRDPKIILSTDCGSCQLSKTSDFGLDLGKHSPKAFEVRERRGFMLKCQIESFEIVN